MGGGLGVLIDLPVETGPDDAAFCNEEGRIVGQSLFQKFLQIRQAVNSGSDAQEARMLFFRKQILEPGQPLQYVP